MDADSPFLDAIQSAPLDDTPRLICADWLEENDQAERAEFIRVQCELERLPENADDRRSELIRRESRLIEQNLERWKDTLPKGNGITWSDFRRGFAEDVRATSGDAFLASVDRVRACTVLLGLGVLGATADFARSSVLAGLHRLHIQSGLGPSGIRALGGSKYVQSLRSLTLFGPSMDHESLMYLPASPNLGRLETLHLGYHENIGAGGVMILADGTLAGHLVTLGVPGCRLTDTGVKHLGAGAFPMLRKLDLTNNQLTNAVGGILSTSEFTEQLRELTLNHNDIGVAGITGLIAGRWTNLRSLSLARNPIGDGGIRWLADAPIVEGLRHLTLNMIGLTDAGVKVLVASPSVARLRTLNLYNNRVTDAGLRAIAASPYLGRLESISLFGCPVTETGVAALAESPRLPRLWKIEVDPSVLTAWIRVRLTQRFETPFDTESQP